MGNLTNAQKSIWVTEQYYRGSSINNICGSAVIQEEVDFDKLEESIKLVCKKHDNFWLEFKLVDGEVKQVLSERKKIQIDTVNIAGQNDLENEINKISRTTFKLENSKLFKFYIFKFKDGKGAFVLNIHHLISDAWTLALICNEIIKTYSALKQNKEIQEKAIYSYIDYIKSEKEYQKSEKFEKDKKYWEERFQNIPEVATIPGSIKEKNDTNNPDGERKQYQIEKKDIAKIKEYCKENRISLYNFFMAVYAIYIGEISGLDEFVIGTPILNRTNFKEKKAAGMFINMAPFKINMDEKIGFQKFVKNIATDSMDMLKHQKYSYQALIENLRKRDKNIPNLYNILLSYQITNAQQTEEDIKYKTEWTFNGCCAEDIDIQIYDLNDTGSLNVAYDYKTSKYAEKDIEAIHKRILNIINQVIGTKNILLKDIDIVTVEEKEKLLRKFNETEVVYDKDATVIELFENKVLEFPDKVALISNGKKLTYKELNERANMLARKMISAGIQSKDIIGIMLNRSPEMIIGLIAILKCGATYLPIDPEYPQDRITYMLENSETKLVLVNNQTQKHILEKFNTINIDSEDKETYSKENINLKLDANTLAYLIYTSGSTGQPKGVMVTNRNLNNFVKGMKEIIEFVPNKNMVSVTTVCFDIFGLEMWCTLTSGMTLVLANEDEQNMPALLNKLCLENDVNMIQTTPSRFSTIFENKENLEFVKNITDILVGGESIGNKLLTKMQRLTKARIFNMYGPTETTIWSTVKELTKEKSISIGKPIANTQCYILNKNQKLLPFEVPGELYIGGDGVSNGYLKREELNKEKFIENPFKDKDKIYNTNDLAYYNENGDIVHLGRTDFQVKIRGFRVELGEIENAIEKDNNIIQSIVVKRKLNNNRDALIAYYTSVSNDNGNIKERISKELPEYMIPQYFVQLVKFPHTQNGKVDRKSLPDPDFKDNKNEIVKPRNELDRKLIKIIEKMLQLERVGINNTLLELGGDSLTAITLSTKILSKFNVQINIKDILTNYSIKDMSDYIAENQTKGTLKNKIEKAPIQEAYPLSSAQKRIYYNVKMIGEDNLVYNMPGGVLVDKILDLDKIKAAFNKILKRHSILRTRFVLKNDNVMQEIEESTEGLISVFYNKENEIKEIAKNFSKPFKMEKEPLIRMEVHYIDNKKTFVLMDAHHIVMDGTSLNNFIIEFERLYNGDNLKNIPIQYKDYAVWEEKYNESDEIKQTENYWINKFKNSDFEQLNLPYDYKMTANRSYNGNKIANVIDEKKFKRIERFAKKIGTSPYMFFISAFYALLYKYTGQSEIILGSPIANRNQNELKRMIGMFVNNIVTKANINPDKPFIEFLNDMKDQILNDLSQQPYPFDMLVKKLGIKADNSRNPLFDVMFTYQNKEENIIKLDNTETQIVEINNNISKFNLSLEIKPKTHTINIEYCTDLFKKDTIERLFEHYMNTIECIMQDINVQIKDIEIISETEKNKILYEFNNTKMDYPKDKIIAELFEEQANKTPNKIAVVFEGKQLTYKEVNEKANQLARYLREEKKIKPNDKIGVMLPRSLELITTLLGVFKSGACYIPIDPTYPEKRIDYMLENSNSKLLLTNKELFEKMNFENKINIEYNNSMIYALKNTNLPKLSYASDLAYVIYTSGSTGNPKGVKITNRNLCNFVYAIKEKVEFDNEKTMVSVTTISFDIFELEIWVTLISGMKLVIASEEEQHNMKLLNKLCVENKVNMIQTTPSRYSLMLEEKNNLEFFENLTDILIGGEAVTEDIVSKIKEISNAKIYDVYGPTETTIWSTIKEITNDDVIDIGRPIGNTQVYILDDMLNVLPIGIEGELYIAGDGVGNGYLNREDLTNERYLKNPFLENSIMYKTGDNCKFGPDGNLHYLGRRDSQIKIRGLRIELEEIERIMLKYAGIQKAKVIKQTIGNREIISAYFIANKRIRISDLREFLCRYLPNYMIPAYFTALDEFPYTPNGKIDKKLLPIPNGILQTENKKYIKPRNELETKIAQIFEEVLNMKSIGINDNFFELGGDSILAMNLNVKLLDITDKIRYADIFTYPTVEKLAEKITSDDRQEEENFEELNCKYKDILNSSMLVPNEIKNNEIGNVLLTGATGYLGIHILDELLKNENNTIYLLVRKEKGMTVEQKVLNKLHYYFENKYDKYIGNRIIIVQGDLTADGFGLQQDKIFEIGNSVSTIINSAAKVSHYGNYLEFYNTNVKSVDKIISFAKTFKCKIYHVSTLSISGNAFFEQYYLEQKFKENKTFAENNLYIGQELQNVYIKTKFEAEKRIFDSILDGVDSYILRMGNLMPRISDGKFQDNYNENAYMNRLKALIKIGSIPDTLLNGYLEFSPIDSSADAIYKIMKHTDSNDRIYHLFNHNHVEVKKLMEDISHLGLNIDVVKNEEFKSKIKRIMKKENSDIINMLMNDFDKNLDLHYDSNIKVDSKQSIKLLKLYGFKWPIISEEYIRNIIKLLKGEENK